MKKINFIFFLALICLTFVSSFAQTNKTDEKAEAVIKKAVENLGGDKYLQVKSQIGRGKFHTLRDGAVLSYQSFVDVIVYPDKERTEFKLTGIVSVPGKEGVDYKISGVKNVQTNSGDTGWYYDGAAQTVNEQTKEQVDNFKRGMRTSIDYLLRGYWRGKADLIYVGKRLAGIGKRNEVVKLVFAEGFAVEFEFTATDLMPVKALYKRPVPDKDDVKEEDRYAQFVDVQGIKAPFIVDHFTNGVQTSRINYETMEFNKAIPDSIFSKPTSAKELKKDLKL